MDKQKEVDVSVITPLYDEPLWMLKRNIESVHSQVTGYTFEHLIVIDNPRPRMEIMAYLMSVRVKYKVEYCMHSKNKGLSAARNTALEKASGEYIMLLDTDDSFVPNRITTQLDYMKESKLDHSFAAYQEIHGNGEPIATVIMPPDFNVSYLLNMQNICYCGSNCFKREVYETLGGFDENMKEGAEDLEYWLRLATNGYRSGCIKKVLYYLGITDNNMTAKLISNGGFGRAYEYIKTKHNHLKFK